MTGPRIVLPLFVCLFVCTVGTAHVVKVEQITASSVPLHALATSLPVKKKNPGTNCE